MALQHSLHRIMVILNNIAILIKLELVGRIGLMLLQISECV